MRFKDRYEAGQKLADALKNLDIKSPYVFGMARGGVPVAYEVAKKLNAPLDVLVVRKLGMPQNPEFGFGAIAPEGVSEINTETVQSYRLSSEQIEKIKSAEESELEERLQKYRRDKKLPDLLEKTAIIVDDGIATGVSAKVAIKYLKSKKPQQIILAAPACAKDSEEKLKKYADKIVCLVSSSAFFAVGQWYENFNQTTDEEVTLLLKQF